MGYRSYQYVGRKKHMELQHRHDDGIGLVHCGLCSSPSHVGENELNINSVGISV